MEILRYVTDAGKDVFGDWLAALRDTRTRAKIAARVARLAAANFGDCKPLHGGVWTCVLLLCGGDKRTQSEDIARAIEYWIDYKQRTRKR